MSMIPKITTESAGIVTTKVSAAEGDTVNAMIIAPNTIKGERKNRRSTMFVAVCT